MKKLTSILLAVLTITMFASVARAEDKLTVTIDDIRDVATQIAEYETEIDMMARLIYAEARGVKSTAEKAAVAWCVLNRVDEGRGTIAEVITARNQFAYNRKSPLDEDLQDLAEDVITRWLLEQKGIENVGRVLPKEYTFFAGRGGRNWFRTGYRARDYWNWSLPDVYEP